MAEAELPWTALLRFPGGFTGKRTSAGKERKTRIEIMAKTDISVHD